MQQRQMGAGPVGTVQVIAWATLIGSIVTGIYLLDKSLGMNQRLGPLVVALGIVAIVQGMLAWAGLLVFAAMSENLFSVRNLLSEQKRDVVEDPSTHDHTTHNRSLVATRPRPKMRHGEWERFRRVDNLDFVYQDYNGQWWATTSDGTVLCREEDADEWLVWPGDFSDVPNIIEGKAKRAKGNADPVR
jgi:hypothetical protein